MAARKGPAMGGSSPRVRGTGFGLHGDERRQRFIPAGAGNRSARKPATPFSTVHPRGCGEQAHRCYAAVEVAGSSPRVRGTGHDHPQGLHVRRFIPAGAGNSGSRPSRRRSGTVHPRGCGEQRLMRRLFGCGVGSSPRVRGTVRNAEKLARLGRFIPAGAGNRRRASA